MSELKIYDVTGKEVGTHDVRINNEVNFKDYQKQYGKQRAEGYADCLRDLFLELEYDVVTVLPPGAADTTFKSANATIRSLHEFYREKSKLLEAVAKITGRPNLTADTNKVKYAAERERKRILRETPRQG